MNWKNFFAAVAGGAIISGSADAAVINEGDRILVAYYSLSGNTQAVAEQIKRETGADVAVIETAEAYPSAYKELTERVEEQTGFDSRLRRGICRLPLLVGNRCAGGCFFFVGI